MSAVTHDSCHKNFFPEADGWVTDVSLTFFGGAPKLHHRTLLSEYAHAIG